MTLREGSKLQTAPAPVIGALLEACSEGVLYLSADGTILEANCAAARLLGQPRQALKGLAFDSGPWRFEGGAPAGDFKAGRIVRALRTEVQHGDGSRRSVVITTTGVPAEPGGTAGWLMTLTEVIGQQSDEETRRAGDLEAISIYAGAIANDFNNILTAILGNVSLAKLDVPQDEEIHRTLTYVERAAIRARDLSRKLFTLPQPGRSVQEQVELGRLVGDSVGLAIRATRKPIRMNLPGADWLVEVSYPSLAQAIRNLIVALAEGGGPDETIQVSGETIRISAGEGPQLQEGCYARITVERSPAGSGAPDYQFAGNLASAGPSLAASDLIIRENRGSIAIAAEAGSAVPRAFQVWLQATIPPAEAPMAQEEAPIPGVGRILVMDDQEMVRGVVERMLTHLGYEVAFTKEGKQAIEAYEAAVQEGRRFDAVILDLDIPGGMGGRETLERLHAIDPAVRGIVSSGYTIDPVSADFLSYGFLATVQKPYEIRALSRVLHDVLAAGH